MSAVTLAVKKHNKTVYQNGDEESEERSDRLSFLLIAVSLYSMLSSMPCLGWVLGMLAWTENSKSTATSIAVAVEIAYILITTCFC